MYRWNSRVPTVRWKASSQSDSGTSSISDATEDTIINSASKKAATVSSLKTSTNSDSCKLGGGNLSGSTLTSCSSTKPTPSSAKPGGAPLSFSSDDATNSCSSKGWKKNSTSNFDTTTATITNNTHPLSTSTSGTWSAESEDRRGRTTLSSANSYSAYSPSDDELDLDEGRHWNWNVIRTFFSLVGIAVLEIRTLSSLLLVRLLVNPINNCVSYNFSPPSPRSSRIASFFSSIWKIVPGGSSTGYYCCKRRNIIISGGGTNSASLRLGRLPCCCTCNCISFLRPILGVCCGSTIAGSYKEGNRSCGSGCSATTTAISRTASASGVGKPRRLGKMAYILSKTMTLLGVAFVIHFIIMSTFAEKEGFHPQPRFPSDGFSNKHHFHHHYNQADTDTDTIVSRRLPRSYRHEKHPTPAPDPNLQSPNHHSRQLNNKSEAVFSTENSTVIIAQIGSKTYLPCAVRNLGSGVASWIRRRDYHLLTVGMGTYSNDDRFMVSHNRPAQSWELHIKYVKPSDEGMYECQISTHPPSSIFVHLRVVEAKAEILGQPDKHVRSGSTFELVCVLRDSTEPPVYVFWYHNDRMINYDNVRGVQVSSDAEKSILTIQEAQKSDSGNYTCVPSNARPTSISVHILNGEKPAAMQHGSRSHSTRLVPACSSSLLLVTALAAFLLTTWLATTNLHQHTLLYFHHQQQHHQYEEKEKKKKTCQEGEHDHSINRTPPRREKGKEGKRRKPHQQNSRHHLHLQLLEKISEGSANEWRRRRPPCRDDENASVVDNQASGVIPNETSTVAISSAIWTMLFLVEVNRRAVDYFSEPNWKKPQAQSFLDSGTFPRRNAVRGSTSPISGGIHRPRPPNMITEGRESSLANSTYETGLLRRVITDGKGNEGEVAREVGAEIIMQDDVANLDQHHRKQAHTLMSFVPPLDSNEEKVMTAMEQWATSIERQKGHNTTDAKLEREEIVDDITLRMEIRDLPYPKNYLSQCRNLLHGYEAGLEGKPLSSLTVVINPGGVAPGVAVKPVVGEDGASVVVTTSSSELSSLSYCSSNAVPTFPQASFFKRFFSDPNPNPTLSLLKCNLKGRLGELPPPQRNPVIVMRDSIVIIPVQVVVIIVVIMVREEVDFSHQQHHIHYEHDHHFSIIVLSASSSYFNSLATNGLLCSSFPPLSLTSSVVAAPSRIIIIPGSGMNKTSSPQPSSSLFCLRRKTEAEEGTCLQEYYSENVPTAATTLIKSCRSSSCNSYYTPTSFDCLQTPHRRPAVVVVR